MFFCRQDITRLPPYKRQVNTVFQKYALFPHLNVFENVAFGLRLQKLDEKEIAPLPGDAGAGGPEGLRTAQHGRALRRQQQRVAIARALVNHPKVFCWTSRWARWT